MIDNGREYIICAALKRLKRRETVGNANPYHEGTNDILDIEIGYRHHDIFQRFKGEVSASPYDQGFYTSKGRFVGREEGMVIACNAGQVPKEKERREDGSIRYLYSEDLY